MNHLRLRNLDKNNFNDIVNMSATELVIQIKSKTISALEVMKAHLAQIEAINPKVKAIRIPLNLPNINVVYNTNIKRKSGEI